MNSRWSDIMISVIDGNVLFINLVALKMEDV